MPAKKKSAPRASKPSASAGKKVTNSIHPREQAGIEVLAIGLLISAVAFFVFSITYFM